MPGRLIGLLVGIDAYPRGVPPLRGCVRDVDAVDRLLRRHGSGFDSVAITRLVDGDATRQAIIEAFRSEPAGAGPGDTVVFFYAGHGSQEPARPEHLLAEPDGRNETLVLVDSRRPGGFDLADKELQILVAEVSAGGAHVLVVLDCCHSGSGVRQPDRLTTRVRRTEPVASPRRASTYLTSSGPGSAARYVLLAACRSDQTAKEVDDGAGSRGAFSVSVEAVLTANPGPLTYALLHRAVVATVAGVVAEQTPVLESPVGGDVGRPFLGGAPAAAAPLLTVSRGRDGWRLDAGTLHGIPPTIDGSRTELTLHALNEIDLGRATAVALAGTTAVRTASSDLDVDGAVDTRATYRAVIRRQPRPAVVIAVDRAVPGRALVSEAIAATPDLVVSDSAADLRLVAADGALHLVRAGAGRAPVAEWPLPAAGAAWTPAKLDGICRDAQHVGRWLGLWRRRNPSSRIAVDGVVLDLLDLAGQVVDRRGGVIEAVHDRGGAARMRVRVRNRCGRRLHVAVLALSEFHGIRSLPLGGGEWLEDGQEVYVPRPDGAGHDLDFYVDGAGRATTDLLKVIASTERFDGTSVDQADLIVSDGRHPARGIGAAPRWDLPERSEDWTTREVLVRTSSRA